MCSGLPYNHMTVRKVDISEFLVRFTASVSDLDHAEGGVPGSWR